uniref:B17.2 n=1 Tax=Polytomella sp. Pringsheim 198.80 TaxID=37502 RepID=UPI001E1E23DD|nr:Chain q, B17.2 [Polytomella sp. Pringsheim 198.80]7ARD_q Chain q, B17.2 [Polytomella sp. Pringsheim 198.80]
MSLTKYLNNLVSTSGKKSLAGFFVSWEFAKMIVDGNLHNNVVRPQSGAQVGIDKFGNKYFEDNEESYGRRRWIVFADKFDYKISSIPPEWHGWLNYINDYKPSDYETIDNKKPMYHAEWTISATGTQECYNPKGSWFNPAKRNWKKVEIWQPPQV